MSVRRAQRNLRPLSDPSWFKVGMMQRELRRSVILTRELPVGGLLANGKYEILETLGSGSSGITYKCKDLETQKEVAVKALSLRSLRSWKQLDLFEREAAALKGLRHPGIPQYLGYCEEDTPDDRRFLLIQELAPGKSLAELVRSGWSPSEEQVLRVAREVLAVLAYLADRRPAVVHRDVSPSNIVAQRGDADGRLSLVDFGGVQAVAAGAGEDSDGLGSGFLPGSTVVGTYGFMAPEQFAGGASPASDLYGLGATLLFLLTGRAPVASDRMRVSTRATAMSPRLRALVEGLLEPMAEDRLSVEEAQEILEGGRARAVGARKRDDAEAGRPAGSRVQVTRRGPRLEIDIPPPGFSGDSLPSAAFALAWNAFVAFWTVSALAGGGILFALFSLPFWAAGLKLSRAALAGQFLRERLQIGLKKWNVKQQLALFRGGQPQWDGSGVKEVGGRSSDLSRAGLVVAGYVNGQPQTQLVLQEGTRKVVLGEGLGLEEQEWLSRLINTHLAANRELRGEEPLPEPRPRGRRGWMADMEERMATFSEDLSSTFNQGRSFLVDVEDRAQREAQRAQRAARQAQRGAEEGARRARGEAEAAGRAARRFGKDLGPRVSPTGTIDVDFDVLDDE
ncbi:Serine/threonine-protein kinase D [Auxenochlorella protothecoides]|uniref:non-specific serine/threonine protein kinase n=1 Tax=Auxenochlorella protothecoides TaxID=3075 RepID=A0A087SBE7_AUXPR|nr:Serine/threonine-protein kinase D [Auxenochlorella protothecoides]KFM23051.1 Serine/threonine-protein kinase D [Auxenochlorella protothecoides]